MDVIILIGQIIIGLLLLTFLVVIHELGHAIVARRNGVVVEEFGIGFPPRAWSRKLKNGILLSINWLPLGGFVKMQGENDSAAKKGDYGAATLWQKTKILLAGVTMNWLFAVVAFTILALVGFPKVIDKQFLVPADTAIDKAPLKVAFIEGNSPAQKAGLKVNDDIVRLDGKKLTTPKALIKATKKNQGDTVSIDYKRGDKQLTTQAKLRAHPKGKQGFLGVSSTSRTTYRSTWSAPIVGVGTTVQFSVVTIQELGKLVGNLFSGAARQLSGNQATRQAGSQAVAAAGSNVAGPIGILGIIFPAAEKAGPTALLFLTGVISLTLAVMNILPIPALDGGRLFLTLLFRGLKKPLTKQREEKIVGTSFALLLLLVVVITVSDVFKFF